MTTINVVFVIRKVLPGCGCFSELLGPCMQQFRRFIPNNYSISIHYYCTLNPGKFSRKSAYLVSYNMTMSLYQKIVAYRLWFFLLWLLHFRHDAIIFIVILLVSEAPTSSSLGATLQLLCLYFAPKEEDKILVTEVITSRVARKIPRNCTSLTCT